MRPFNWKKYPADVFFLMVPLASMGLILTGHVAILQWRINHDHVYAWIWLGGIALLAFGLWPFRRLAVTQSESPEPRS